MQEPPTPIDESRRLAALYDHQLLDTANEELFDAFTRLAAQMCGTQISLIGLVDADRMWFKSNYGWPGVTEIAREDAPCAVAIASKSFLEIPDALANPKFASNRLVTGPPHIRFYAGAPLVTDDGYALGTISVIDRTPRELTAAQRSALTSIADAIVEQFAARRASQRLFDSAGTEFFQLELASERVLFASEGARRNLGYELADVAGVPVADVFPELSAPGRLIQRLHRLSDNLEKRITLQTVARRRDGSTYPTELRVELITLRKRQIAMVYGVDLTEQMKTREKITFLAAAMEVTDDAVIIARPGATASDSATIVWVNEGFLRQKGATPEQVLGKTAERWFGAKTDLNAVREMRDKLMRGEPARLEYITYRADGSHYYAGAVCRPLRNERGETTHFVVIQHDVSEDVLRGMQLAMQNERLTALTSIARGIFASLEPAALVSALLTGVRELVGADARLLVARPNGGFAVTPDLSVPERAAAAGDDFVETASRSDVTMLSEDENRSAIRIPGSLGQTRYILDVRSDRPLHTADIFALGLLGQYFAVAARNVELYGELQTRRAAVVELNQVKNDLIAMLAHDFKGPLTTIVGFADVLAEDDRFDDESRKFLAMISSSAMRLASLATDTLALSRLEQNELALIVEEFDLVPLVREIVRVFSVTRSIELRSDRPELVIGGDPSRLRQVFENLIGNAIKYSPGGEPIEVYLRMKGRGVECSVRDQGIGIPEADKPKLFGRFARAQNARAMGISGTGFGLYLTKTIVEMHGGTISVDSREGGGSTFRVFLPSALGAPRPQHRRYILNDPDGDSRSYVAHTLRDDGGAVTVVDDADAMLAAIDETQFDAAIVDIERLGMAPDVFVRRVFGRTALVRIDTAPVEETEGWDGYLVKPFLMKDLNAAMAAAIARHPKPERALSFQ
jgi:PAS domain S-box-containing protein